ncbi:MAG: GNAT family N-acetyltransferase [Deltaproteobacteria bacterium]|nr:GNAT family N-acetyltransferase [Deltaproteobacteria bacterium]
MQSETEIVVFDGATPHVDDREIETLLQKVYVGEGFTDPEIAKTAFVAATVRGRGRVFAVRDSESAELIGMVILAAPSSRMWRVDDEREAEVHLLAVSQDHRESGVGRALIEAVVRAARAERYVRLVLWTQPTMHAAQRLYERCGFVRCTQRDWARNGRPFWVYELVL